MRVELMQYWCIQQMMNKNKRKKEKIKTIEAEFKSVASNAPN